MRADTRLLYLYKTLLSSLCCLIISLAPFFFTRGTEAALSCLQSFSLFFSASKQGGVNIGGMLIGLVRYYHFTCFFASFEVSWILFYPMQKSVKEGSVHFRQVWDTNLDEEFGLIREIVDDYPYIAMDTEFPGVVFHQNGDLKNKYELNYGDLKENVDNLKLIQLGLTFSDEEGNLPTCGTDKGCIWQFNFREFNVNKDISAYDSIELLRQCGIDFDRNNKEGVNIKRFGELIMSSGVVLNDDVQWAAFHGGYDFGYFLKLLTCKKLPDTQSGFYDLIKIFFPILYDVKYLMRFRNGLHGGLEKLAGLLQVERIGTGHQAGSDSLLTSCVFRKMKKDFFVGSLEKYAGILHNLSVD